MAMMTTLVRFHCFVSKINYLLCTDGPPDPPLREPLQPPVEHEYVGISCYISVCYNVLLFSES